MQSILSSTKPDFSLVPGGWEPDEVPILHTTSIRSSNPFSNALLLENVLSPDDCQALIQFMNRSPKIEPVSIQGKIKRENDVPGSYRTTVWSEHLATQLWTKISPYLPTRNMTEKSFTDWWQKDKQRKNWTPVACSPLLRFMRYLPNGHHYAHYDAGFIYPDDSYRTLQSMVLYLTTSNQGGDTRFIEDGQDKRPIWERTHDDWTREAEESEVLYRSKAIAGNVFIFDHRICHDVEKNLDSNDRVIVRGDILYKAID